MAVALFLAALATLALASASARDAFAASSQTLYGGFDADGNISLTYADGTPIGTPTPPGTLIPSGTYTVEINNNGLDDLGNPHEFELMGPGVDESAGTAVQVTWTVTFAPDATYVYEDADNPTTQYEVFGTAGSGATSTTAGGPAANTTPTTTEPAGSGLASDSPFASSAGTALKFEGTLSGAVSSKGKLTLTFKHRAVTTLAQGRYTITVSDKSRSAGFTIQEKNRAATTVTGSAFVGTRSVTVALTAGQWFFYPSFLGTKTYFVVTS